MIKTLKVSYSLHWMVSSGGNVLDQSPMSSLRGTGHCEFVHTSPHQPQSTTDIGGIRGRTSGRLAWFNEKLLQFSRSKRGCMVGNVLDRSPNSGEAMIGRNDVAPRPEIWTNYAVIVCSQRGRGPEVVSASPLLAGSTSWQLYLCSLDRSATSEGSGAERQVAIIVYWSPLNNRSGKIPARALTLVARLRDVVTFCLL